MDANVDDNIDSNTALTRSVGRCCFNKHIYIYIGTYKNKNQTRMCSHTNTHTSAKLLHFHNVHTNILSLPADSCRAFKRRQVTSRKENNSAFESANPADHAIFLITIDTCNIPIQIIAQNIWTCINSYIRNSCYKLLIYKCGKREY